MSRLNQALGDLNRNGYTFSSLNQLSGGINSATFQAKSADAVKFALKLYPLPSKNDPRNRCQAENNFLSYLKSCQVHNTPSLLESNMTAGWSLMSWIEGRKPKKVQASDLQEITDFISLINKDPKKMTRCGLEPASEACESLTELITSIAQRIKRYRSSRRSSEVSREAILWINKTIEPQFRSISQRLLETRAQCSHWRDLHACRIASPSDVGIHNTLRTQQGLHFLDFEYAGIDDLSKLAADWILQPEYRLDQTQEEIFTELLRNSMKQRIGTSWHTRFNDIKPLIHIKWCLIMLNQLQKNNLSQRQLEKAMDYFEAT